MIGDHYTDKWRYINPINPFDNSPSPHKSEVAVTRYEFDELKREVLEMKELLKRAIEYDKKNNEPDCHIDEKIEKLRKIAELVGVDLKDVLGK
jgi:archaellum component FlaC